MSLCTARRVLVTFLTGILLFAIPGIAFADEPDRSPWPIMPTGPVHLGVCPPVPGLEDLTGEAPRRHGSRERPGGYPAGVNLGSDQDTLVYAALGDSFAAGEGAPDNVTDSCGTNFQDFVTGTAIEGNHCHRSANAYPVKLWEALEAENPAWTLDHRACSGATSKHFEDEQSWDETWGPFNKREHEERANPPQWASDSKTGHPKKLDTTRRANLVTITMTGNDIGFADIVKDCVTDIYSRYLKPYFFWVDCSDDRDVLIEDKASDIRKRLVSTYRSVQANLAEGGQLLVSGYPRPFPTTEKMPAECGLGVLARISKEKMKWLNSIADQANKITEEAVREVGATYVDASDILQDGDHTMCEDVAGPEPGKRWINRVIPTSQEWSAHPNSYLLQAQANRMLTCFKGLREGFCHRPAPVLEVAPSQQAMLPPPPPGQADQRSMVTIGRHLLLPDECGDYWPLLPQDAYGDVPLAGGVYVLEEPGQMIGKIYMHLIKLAPGRKEGVRAYLDNLPKPCVGHYGLGSPPLTFKPITPAQRDAGDMVWEFDADDPEGSLSGAKTLVLTGDYLLQVVFVRAGTDAITKEQMLTLYHRELGSYIYPHLGRYLPGF